MPKSPHPHVSWRDGRPRFEPGPALRAAGHRGRDLKHPDGRWFSKGEAVDWSISFAASLRAGPAPRGRPRQQAARPAGLTLGQVVEQWQASSRWQAEARKPLRASTMRDYRQKLKVVQDDRPDLWVTPAAALIPADLQVLYDEIEERRGLATARGCIAVLQSAFRWAISRGVVRLPANPAQGLQVEMPPPRIRFATRAEVAALLAAATALGREDVGDAIVLGLWTGQRQGDRLLLQDRGLYKGRRMFRQAKTAAIVQILQAPEVEARLAASAARRRAANVVSPWVLLNEHTWQPWQPDTYRHEFVKVREKAAEACPSVADFRDQDLRDTAVTWMALAEADVPQIAAVTGHSLQSVTTTLRHYLARHPEMADSAIRKVIAWYDSNGETEIG